ncbi:MAG: 2-oxoacid:acceptor oxidoreductase family protein [Crocinitomicaceae bacterium]|nr:2-oxoacid:acceptor oxidoreductase family protein [Crocinitomicaceae bacterium]
MKILVAGVGGQGIVYLTNILAEAALLSDIPVSVSEIHGLSQRGGVVTAGIGLGKYNTGFIGKANVDFLFGLEPLETQRCLLHLHRNSSVIFCDYKIAPYSVNAETAKYPDVNSFADYLKGQCKEVVCVDTMPETIDPVLCNVFLLGRAIRMKDFPFTGDSIEKAICNTVMDYHKEKTLTAFRMGKEYYSELQKT